jgi:hypothetical protein
MKLFTYIALLCCLTGFSQDIETIAWKTTNINDRIDLKSSLKDFEKLNRRADSLAVATPQDLCGLKNMEGAQLLYFKGVKYAFKNDTLTFRSVDFSKRRRMYLATATDWFDHTTTFKTFAKTYPGAASYPDYYEDDEGKEYDMYVLLSDEAGSEDEWRFYFSEGKLHHVDYWSPCD